MPGGRAANQAVASALAPIIRSRVIGKSRMRKSSARATAFATAAAAGPWAVLYSAVSPNFLFALASIFFFSDSDSLPFLTI
jgi:hypothetical protein